jgi:hypothetical protein
MVDLWIKQYSDVSCIKNICYTEEFTWKIKSITFSLDKTIVEMEFSKANNRHVLGVFPTSAL